MDIPTNFGLIIKRLTLCTFSLRVRYSLLAEYCDASGSTVDNSKNKKN